MIIKSKTIRRKTNHCFTKLVDYVLNPEKGHQLLFSRFIRGGREDLISGFVDNENERRCGRSRPVKLHHVILSFKEEDRNKLQDKTKLKKLAKYFTELYGAESPMICALHSEEDKQPHLHLLFGIQINGMALRVEKKRFEEIKLLAENKQNELFKLKHSGIQHGKKGRRTSDREYHLHKKGKVLSKEEQIEQIQELYQQSTSPKSFIEKLTNSEIPLYTRGNRIQGVLIKTKEGKPTLKVRLSTLGFSTEKILALHRAWEKKEIKKRKNTKRYEKER